jgi:antitoxin CcdA
MRKYRIEQVEQKIVDKVVCDVCKKEFDDKVDWEEVQEFHCIDFVGGYGSIFGDGVTMKADICQHCLKKLVGEYLVRDNEVVE